MKKFAVASALMLLLAAPALQAKGKFNPMNPMDPETLKKINDGVKKGFDDLNKYLKQGKDASDFLDKYEPLTSDDADYDDAYNDAGAPQVPSNCAGSDDCGACFEDAYDQLNEQRFRLAKLDRVYKSSMRMAKSAIAFGDNVSGVHGIAGLGWQLQGRKPIEDSMKSFQKTSENKHEEIVADLHGALIAVAACEQEYYGEEDWYNRYGFIYYQFMADRYRPDAY